MKIHFIAIGGSAMHNLALALHHQGHSISGSDDEIFEPSKSRLENAGLLPEAQGWFSEKIHTDLDAVILGMHAKADNPELIRSRELGLKIYSYPEFLYEQSKDKKRVVIAGSHGKTTITAMVMHVLQQAGIDFDFMVGAQLEGFDVMVKMSEEAGIMLFEGDEYLTSALDPRPKFHLYRPHLALISGIAWDHINVFPSFANYLTQFEQFIRLIEPGGTLVYYSPDKELEKIARQNREIKLIPYSLPHFEENDGVLYLHAEDKKFPLKIFGLHNMQNLCGAIHICRELGIDDVDFAHAISDFAGASKRLQFIGGNDNTSVYLDFAHAPSKLMATVEAVKGHFKAHKLVACMELHTYSSLNKAFLDQYRGTMDLADIAFVYYNPHTLALKRLPPITPRDVQLAFARNDLRVFNDSTEMLAALSGLDWKNSVLLLMSSGNFDGLQADKIAARILA
ncbi:MAG: Mur ligase family protein [Bacteroidales bacterium]|nr:Mur ligase family protein [Bacteroidales bacterium]